jgi:hypothetical protein
MLLIFYDMTEEKRRVNAAIDIKLYENVMKLGYSISEAITLGLEKLLEPVEESENAAGTKTPEPESSPNDGLVAALEGRISSLESQLKTKDTQIEKKDNLLEAQAVQLQTMISQKAIEAPGAKKWWQFWR